MWRVYIEPAHWLAAADGPNAWLWCELQAEAALAADRGDTLPPARLRQLRGLAHDLGLTGTHRPVEAA